ncbi:MAG: PHP domain-containing protein [Defluviitaleaceae bacterium]|nr:PHP domain-containing protein [Defluviitaleaceae bacterium]
MTNVYKFDPHTHTAESSGCSNLTANQLVESYHAAGFGGIAITDHLADYNMHMHSNWDTCIDYLIRGYNAAKARGDELGLDVILGVEIRFDETFCDYLLYGVSEDFLRKNPYLYRLGLRELYKRHGGELLIIQAHPYRGTGSPDIGFMHGVEVYNGNPRHKNRNNKTRSLCEKHPKLYQTSASDTHETEDIGTGWMEFTRPVVDSFQFKEMVERGEYVTNNY